MKINMGSATDEQLKELFPDLPSGPLDGYRQKASFDWRQMKLAYDTLSTMKLKNDMWTFMHRHPLFQHPVATPTVDDERQIATKRMYALYSEKFLSHEKIMEDPSLAQAETEAYFMLDGSLAGKLWLTFKIFTNAILGSGTEKHLHYVEDIRKAKIGGCFALTEVSHGSNAKGMRTTATYLPEKKQFVLHTPDFDAAKCWVGCLGKCATHAIVYAMLISKRTNYGLHAFVVPIRDTRTLKALPGVTVGDMGETIGLRGTEYGFVMFNNYHLPKDAALDKLGGVDDCGDYQTPFEDPAKRFGASLGVLSGGRVFVTSVTANFLQKAVVIAIRYSAARMQFGPEGGDELPVLEYQLQQTRLLPYLAAAYALRVFANWFSRTHLQLTNKQLMGMDNPAVAAALGQELHALSSAAKAVAGWTARDGIQSCREACGGHGYLKAARLGQLRDENDANVTYEGENGLLLQQTSNFLLRVWPKRHRLAPVDSPLETLEFLFNADRLLNEKCSWSTVQDIVDPNNLVRTYQWLTAYTLRTTADKVAELKAQGRDSFSVKNDSQAFNAATLSTVYGESYILQHFLKTALAVDDTRCRHALLTLVALYGAFMLDKHLATLYIGGYFGEGQGVVLREGIILLCARAAPDAVVCVDALAPPDWCLNSLLGMADGEVYKHIQNSFVTYPGALQRPQWWRDVIFWDSYVPSKL